jgi:hypothetical protein
VSAFACADSALGYAAIAGCATAEVIGGGSTVMQNMMDNMMGGMGWTMGLVGLMVLLALILGVAALMKYLFK